MSVSDEVECDATKSKLSLLEARYQILLDEAGELTYARRKTMQSLKRLINQMREEVVRFEAQRHSASHEAAH